MVCGTDGYIATKQGLKKLLTIFSSLYLPVDLQMIAHMESMKDYDHHLVKCRQEGAPLLRSYTMPSIAFHGSFSSDIR
jgi:GR25 family glycosyltransferase involved in LPS biosynthesis